MHLKALCRRPSMYCGRLWNKNLKPIVVINKIDKPDARVTEVEDEVLELFMELDANDEQLDFPVIYANGRDGIAKTDMADEGTDLQPLFNGDYRSLPVPEGRFGRTFAVHGYYLGLR